MKQRLVKIISAMLVIAILYANSAAVISYAAENLLSDKELENQKTQTNNANVEFDVYYDGGQHKAYADVNSTDTKLNLAVKVKEAGYLKDISVNFIEPNFGIVDDGTDAERVQKFDSENKAILLNQIEAGENVTKSFNVIADKSDIVSENAMSKDNAVELKAKYINKDGKEIAINKTIIINTSWTCQDAKTKLSYEITKYIPYSAGTTNKIITQAKITSGIQDSVLPIKETSIEIIAPKINNENPESVTVVANSTAATNGEEKAESFTQNNYVYDKDSGKIVINVKNEAKNGNISWKKNALDEFIITYVYSESAYNSTKDQVTRISYEANSKIALYNCGNGVTSATAKVNGYEDQLEKVGELVDFNVAATEKINKGYMYTNKIASDANKKETNYTETYTASIAFADVIDNIEILQKTNKFVQEDKTEKDVESIDKMLTISKVEFDNILGENGQITISNSNGEKLQTIDKNTNTTGENIEVDLTNYNVGNIIITTSKPQKNGNISFEITRAINSNMQYSQSQIEKFEKINTQVTGIAKNGKNEIVKQEKEVTTALEEPTHKAFVTTNTDTLSTIVENKDVKFTVTLENDIVDDKLYTNPKITLKLPVGITKIDGSAQVTLDEELNIADTRFVDNNDGTKDIEIQLNGKQTKYNNAAAKGATIVIKTNITLNNLTPSTNTQIGLKVQDGDGTIVENSKEIEYVAPTGVVTTNTVSEYNGASPAVMSISGEQKEALIPTLSGAKTPVFTMNVINNYDTVLNNVVVLGRTPYAGNKDIATNADLGSTMTMDVASAINVSNSSAKVYYSENENATKDLAASSNGWKETISDLSKIKSYMIIFENYDMPKGDSFTFSYKANLAANLEHNKSAYENYIVYFSNKDSQSNLDSAIATKVGVTTGSGAVIKAQIESENNSTTIASGELLKYKLVIENTGTEAATGLQMSIQLKSNMMYVEKDESLALGYKSTGVAEYDSIENSTDKMAKVSLPDIAAHSKLEKEIWIKTQEDSNEEYDFNTKVTISNGDVKTETNSIAEKITRTYFIKNISREIDTIDVGTTNSFTISVASTEFDYSSMVDENSSYEYKGERKNTNVKFNLPEELSIVSVQKGEEDITNTISNKNGEVIIPLGNVTGNTVKLTIMVKAEKINDGYTKEVTIAPSVYAENVAEEQIGTLNIPLSKPGLEIKQTSDIPSSIKINAAERYTYTFTIKNPSKSVIGGIDFVDYLPKELTYSGMEVQVDNGMISSKARLDENGNPTTQIGLLNGGAEAVIKVHVVAAPEESDYTVVNKASISQERIGTIESNEITTIVQAYSPSNPDNSENPSTPEERTRRIAGTIWIDKNADGIRDIDEQLVAGTKVLLLDNLTGNVALDKAGNQAITTTDSNGAYAFTNIKQGRYTVIFFYDSANYSITEYQKAGVDSAKNSDAVEKTVVYEEKEQKAGVSAEIVLKAEDVYNIDLGLVEDKKFDLKLDKIVSNITVNNKKETSTHDYNKNFAKIDFETKYVNTATMVVEYKITVTNEGAIPGYAKKIADYLPSELKFSTDLNQDWYEGKNGVIYNNSLANTVINPGESKEIKLILTKSMNKESFGTITNNAEIYEASNDYGVKDTDSTPGNKNTSEDDYSTATIVTGVKTGQIFIYTTLIATVIAIVGVGSYMIKKRVLK